ncbi:hypothetical protein BEWA_028450 [Theileria equi strain WA]|uniref:Uncharacterized protein n=1 Tax=Theileria equi strain WA TaxID=1537102 RepID=L0AWS3_THEEQ|nr:hypothetical protein BEWA_028450 [Theileria equi strain WA]AFZ79995.1 hypothetical protein BEWA_028450 [Theileria equi strain WA]|eukprot:XP_004829661.1 hypothetical protein BEWA_028450 [Theileria equi strain WA]
MAESAEFVATVGIDAGGDSCRLCVAKSGQDRVNLHVNRVSNRQTPALVSFDKRLRIYGEEAEARAASLFKNSVPLPLYISGLDKDSLGEYIKTKKYLFGSTFDKNNGAFSVTFDDAPYQVYPAEILSFFVDKVLDTVRKECEVSTSDGNNKFRVALSLPIYLSEETKKGIYNSLSLTG